MANLLKSRVRLFIILFFVFAAMVSYALQTDYNVGYAPVQPIAYSHKLHAGKLGIDCLYCHSSAEKSAHATVPPLSTCMGCHSVVATQEAEIKKLADYWEKQQPVPWVRIHRVPDHAYFNHSVHLNANIACQTCHGEVQTMEVVQQVRNLEMGDCVTCHKNSDVISKSLAENSELKDSKYFYLRYMNSATKNSLNENELLNVHEGLYHEQTGMKKYQNAPLTCDICHQ